MPATPGTESAMAKTVLVNGASGFVGTYLSYLDLLEGTGAVQDKRPPNLTVPLRSPRLSALWLTLVTDVDTATARDLVESMTVETLVRDHTIQDVLPGPCAGFDDAAGRALAACGAAPRRSHGRSNS